LGPFNTLTATANAPIKATPYRTDNPGDTIKARALRAKSEMQELTRAGSPLDEGGWDKLGAEISGSGTAESPLTLESLIWTAEVAGVWF